MDLQGYRAISEALHEANIDATVAPKPQDGQNVEYVTVSTEENVAPADVLNALCKVGLMAKTPAQQAAYDERHLYRDAVFVDTTGPKLEPLFGQSGSTTFADTNNGH